MKTVVIKRDGSQVPFNAQRIAEAILKASGAARCKGDRDRYGRRTSASCSAAFA